MDHIYIQEIESLNRLDDMLFGIHLVPGSSSRLIERFVITHRMVTPSLSTNILLYKPNTHENVELLAQGQYDPVEYSFLEGFIFQALVSDIEGTFQASPDYVPIPFPALHVDVWCQAYSRVPVCHDLVHRSIFSCPQIRDTLSEAEPVASS